MTLPTGYRSPSIFASVLPRLCLMLRFLHTVHFYLFTAYSSEIYFRVRSDNGLYTILDCKTYKLYYVHELNVAFDIRTAKCFNSTKPLCSFSRKISMWVSPEEPSKNVMMIQKNRRK